MRVRLLPAILAAIAAAVPTSDLEAQWQILESHTTADLRGIHSVGNGIAWASGTAGTVLRTTDNGATWQRCPTPPSAEHLDFRGIQAFDATTAIVMSSGKGDLSRLYKTTDGCKSWKLVFTNPDAEGFWDAVQVKFGAQGYPQRINGVLIGDPVDGKFSIFISSDSGDSWRRWGNHLSGWKGACGERNARAKKDEALFAASNESLLFSSGPTSFLFVTGGKQGARLISSNWSEWDGPPCSTNFLSDSLDESFRSSSSGAFAAAASRWDQWLPEKIIVMVGDYSRPDNASCPYLITQSSSALHLPFTNYFKKPERAQTPPHGYRSAVAYDATHKTWITVGPNGTDISTDDGKIWRALKPSPGEAPDADRDWNALSLPFVVGPHGRIGRLRPEALPIH